MTEAVSIPVPHGSGFDSPMAARSSPLDVPTGRESASQEFLHERICERISQRLCPPHLSSPQARQVTVKNRTCRLIQARAGGFSRPVNNRRGKPLESAHLGRGGSRRSSAASGLRIESGWVMPQRACETVIRRCGEGWRRFPIDRWRRPWPGRIRRRAKNRPGD